MDNMDNRYVMYPYLFIISYEISFFLINNLKKIKTKNSKNYRSDVIHKITHSNTTHLQFYTLSILHSTNPTLFQSYTLQSYTLPISHSSNPTLFQSYTLSILYPFNPTSFQSYSCQSFTLPILHSSNLTFF